MPGGMTGPPSAREQRDTVARAPLDSWTRSRPSPMPLTWIPEHLTLVFADALAAPRGQLLVWDCPALRERALPAVQALLELPFERVIVSHGQPGHDRAAYERTLTLPPWRG